MIVVWAEARASRHASATHSIFALRRVSHSNRNQVPRHASTRPGKCACSALKLSVRLRGWRCAGRRGLARKRRHGRVMAQRRISSKAMLLFAALVVAACAAPPLLSIYTVPGTSKFVDSGVLPCLARVRNRGNRSYSTARRRPPAHLPRPQRRVQVATVPANHGLMPGS